MAYENMFSNKNQNLYSGLNNFGFSTPNSFSANGLMDGMDWTPQLNNLGSKSLFDGSSLMNNNPIGGGYGNLGIYGTGPGAGGGFWGDMSGAQKMNFGLDAMGKVAGLFMGLQQYGLAKKQFDFQKDAFERQYAAQRDTANTRMEDRQRARVASNPGAYESVDSYMNRNQIK